MYTEKRYPGKFEGCKSQLIGRILNDITLEGFTNSAFGDCFQEYGEWYGLIKGKKWAFIVREDDHGFFDYSVHELTKVDEIWKAYMEEYEN